MTSDYDKKPQNNKTCSKIFPGIELDGQSHLLLKSKEIPIIIFYDWLLFSS